MSLILPTSKADKKLLILSSLWMVITFLFWDTTYNMFANLGAAYIQEFGEFVGSIMLLIFTTGYFVPILVCRCAILIFTSLNPNANVYTLTKTKARALAFGIISAIATLGFFSTIYLIIFLYAPESLQSFIEAPGGDLELFPDKLLYSSKLRPHMPPDNLFYSIVSIIPIALSGTFTKMIIAAAIFVKAFPILAIFISGFAVYSKFRVRQYFSLLSADSDEVVDTNSEQYKKFVEFFGVEERLQSELKKLRARKKKKS